jgi:peptide subunit release factor 1 (eRF1)
MVDAKDVTELLGVHAPGSSVVSVYLDVPLDPAGLRGIPARLDDLFASAWHEPGGGEAVERARRAELPAIRDIVALRAREWPRHAVAIFASRDLGLMKAIPLRNQAAERAVVAARPYVRPLLAELRRSPCYAVAVVDRRYAWLYRVTGERIEWLTDVESRTVRSRRFGGFRGFQTYQVEQRARNLAREHCEATMTALERAITEGGCGPITVGGHEDETAYFVDLLPATLRDRLAGTFVIDPHTMTAAHVRRLADEVVVRWEEAREAAVAGQITGQPTDPLAAIGLPACLNAANQHAIQVLVVPDDAVALGFVCPRCGDLAAAGGACPVCGAPTSAVPDVVEELAVKATEDGGTVEPVRDGNIQGVAARRRFPAWPVG